MSDSEADNTHENTLVIPEQAAIHVHTNAENAVMISQDDASQDERHFVYIHRWHLPKLIERLQSYVDDRS